MIHTNVYHNSLLILVIKYMINSRYRAQLRIVFVCSKCSKMAATIDSEFPKSAMACIEACLKQEKFKDYKLKIYRATARGDNFLGEIFRVVADGKNEAGIKTSISFIVKLAPLIKGLREIMSLNLIYCREYFVYSKILPILDELQIESNIPKEERFHSVKFYRGNTEECKETLVMEDLIVLGFKMYDRFKSFDKDHLELCIKTLARYHATTLVLKEKYPDKYAECCKIASLLSDFGDALDMFIKTKQKQDKNKNVVLALIKDEGYRSKLKYTIDNMYSELERCLEPKISAPYNVLCHGDCWSNNLLFKYRGKCVEEVRFVDWQIMREASPVTDIFYLIFTATDRKTRKECYEEMLDLYYTTLSFNVTKMGVDISKCYPESVYRQHLKEYAVFGLIMSIGILPITLSNKGEAHELINTINKNSPIDISEICGVRLKEILEDYVDNCLI